MAACSNCGEQFSDRRKALNYHTCLPCGDAVARTVRWLSAPLNKGAYQLVSVEELKQLNPKRLGE
jgi:hypothetical protein